MSSAPTAVVSSESARVDRQSFRGVEEICGSGADSKPLCIDLFCGLGGWAEGLLAEGYDVMGFDVEQHDYGTGGYPGQLVLQDVLTLDGAQFRNAAVIMASPPCQAYSYMAMPWSRAKREISWQRWAQASPFGDFRLNKLFDACFRIQREASEAAGRRIPLVVENVKGAQPWVGRARWHYGSYYLWGDIPALMLSPSGRKSQHTALVETPEGTGRTSWFFGNSKHEGRHYGMETKNNGGSWLNLNGRKGTGGSWMTPNADARTPGHWKESGCVTRCFNSKDSRRKAASAQIAKIPFELARHIASVYKPSLVAVR
jgi:hypothetical protein